MARLISDFVSAVVDSAVKEVLKKTGIAKTATKRTKGKTAKTKSGGLLADILDAALERTPAKKPARKQTSGRKTAAAGTKTRRRTT